MTRLLREDNPTPGLYPAVVPQHFDADGQTMLKTGKQNPLPVLLYGPNGQPISSSSPLVTSPIANRATTLVTNTPLGANGTYTQPWQDANALGVNYVSASVYSDKSGTLYIDLADDTNNPMLGVQSVSVTGGTPTRLQYPQTITTRYWRLRYVNGGTAQTNFELYQTTLPLLSPRDFSLTGRNVQDIVLVNALAVTDTSTHSSGSINVSALSGRKIVTISSTLNQDTTVSIIARDQRGNGVTMGTVTVAASTGGTIIAFVAPEGSISAKSSTGSFTLLASPFWNMEIRVSCSTAPTSGSISVYLEGVSA